MNKIIVLVGLFFCLFPLKGITKTNTITGIYSDTIKGLDDGTYWANIDYYGLDGSYVQTFIGEVWTVNNVVVKIDFPTDHPHHAYVADSTHPGGKLIFRKSPSKSRIISAKTIVIAGDINGGKNDFGN